MTDQTIIDFLARQGCVGEREYKKLAALKIKAEETRIKAEAARDAFNLKQTERALKQFTELVTLEEVGAYIGVAAKTVRGYGENKRRALQRGVTELTRC